MRIIIDCDPANFDAAIARMREEVADNWQARYDRPGWGWHFPLGQSRCFVRGIKGGISLKQVSA